MNKRFKNRMLHPVARAAKRPAMPLIRSWAPTRGALAPGGTLLFSCSRLETPSHTIYVDELRLDGEEEETWLSQLMSLPPSTPTSQASAIEPLQTREVFLDTEVYRTLGFDRDHPSILALKDYVRDDRLALHLTDITQEEIKRRITEMARHAIEQLAGALNLLTKWKRRAPKSIGDRKIVKLPTVRQVADEALATFLAGLTPCTTHQASHRDPRHIFRAYFERRAPFDASGGKSVKEFPDAFVLEALDAWCRAQNTQMYVITLDGAMRRAAEASTTLIPLETLDQLLEAATVNQSPNVITAVEAIFDEIEFPERLAAALDTVIDELELIYMGDLYDGEASDPARAGDPKITNWSVISAGDGGFGLIIDLSVDLLAQVQFEDTSMAMYDKEDGVYVGAVAAQTEVEVEGADLRLFAQLQIDGTFSRVELLTTTIDVYGDEDNYK